MQHVIVLLSLVLASFAAETKVPDLGLPKPMTNKNFLHLMYEGTLKTSSAEIPVTGEWFYHARDDTIEYLDSLRFELSGKKWKIDHVAILDPKSKELNAYLVVNDKCLPTVYSEEDGTFPEISAWREIGDNKFERSITNKFALNDVMKSRTDLGMLGAQEHEMRFVIRITLSKNKIKHFQTILYVDGQQIAEANSDVTRTVKGSVDESRFRIPAVCKKAERSKQLKVATLAVFFLGFLEGENENTGGKADIEGKNEMNENKGKDEMKEAGKDGMKEAGKDGMTETDEIEGKDEAKETDEVKEAGKDGMKETDANDEIEGKDDKIERGKKVQGKEGMLGGREFKKEEWRKPENKEAGSKVKEEHQ